MNATYLSGFLTGFGAGTGGIWLAIGNTTLACVAAAVAVAGIVIHGVAVRNNAKASP
ncbi:hypothetical protein [Ralstonia sp. ASV6]|uniref:hypothetical protein n=1 Tax=Ralstonia sp. ASV6 TaxID=2795124 RepID=UPI0018ECEDE3|nr:hypothetical protein [Ralstonia sp. ASV6]